MIIDFHTHNFPEQIAARAIGSLSAASHTVPFTDGTVNGVLASMKEAGFDCSVVLPVATSARQVEHINDSALRSNERFSEEGLISLGCMHPDYEGWKDELARIKENGLRGIKIHPVYQGVDLDDPKFLRILDRCAELGLFVVTHSGDDIGFPGVVHCSPQMAKNALAEIGRGTGSYRLILAHMGGWRCWDEVEALAPALCEAGPVMIDTSFSEDHFEPLDDGYWRREDTGMLDDAQFTRIIRAFGAERVLFGTDSPWSPQKKAYEWVLHSSLTEKEKELIFSENAKRLLA